MATTKRISQLGDTKPESAVRQLRRFKMALKKMGLPIALNILGDEVQLVVMLD